MCDTRQQQLGYLCSSACQLEIQCTKWSLVAACRGMPGTRALKSQLSLKQRLCMPPNTETERKKTLPYKNHMLFFPASHEPPSIGDCSESASALIIFPHVKAFIPADILNENTKLIYQSFFLFPHHPMQLYPRCNTPVCAHQLKAPQDTEYSLC